MNLKAKLEEILPSLLPKREQDAIKGTELIARVRAVLGDSYSDRSLRSQFSFLVLEPESCLARVPNGQGYYLRGADSAPASLHDLFEQEPETADGGDSLLRRALALAVRLYDTAGMGVFAYPVEEDGISWEHPDLVAVQWPAGHTDTTGAYQLARTEDGSLPRAAFRAVCVAGAGTQEECRQAFYRALACGQWAQETELLLLGTAEDVPDELLRLATLYGVGIRTLDADEQILGSLPRANEIFRSQPEDARSLLGSLPQSTLAHPRHRVNPPATDDDLPDIATVLGWVETCLRRGRIEPYEQRVAVH